MNFKDVVGGEAGLLLSLARMVDQYTTRGEEFTSERFTFPYSALANAVLQLSDYGLVEVVGGFGRVVEFRFVDDAREWIY